MKKNKLRRLYIPDVKTYYEATMIKTMQIWGKDQWTRNKSSEINPYFYCQLISKCSKKM